MFVDGKLRLCGMQAVESCNEDVAKSQKASDIGYASADELIRQLGWGKDDIRLLLFFTQTSDYLIPSTASLIQKRLQIGTNCLVYDVNSGADSFARAFRISISMLEHLENGAKGILIFADAYADEMNKRAVAMAVERDPGHSVNIWNVSYSADADRLSADIKYEIPKGDYDFEKVCRFTDEWIERFQDVLCADTKVFVNDKRLCTYLKNKGIKDVSSSEETCEVNHCAGPLFELVKKYHGEKARYALVAAGAGLSLGGAIFNINEKIYCNVKETDELYDDLQ